MNAITLTRHTVLSVECHAVHCTQVANSRTHNTHAFAEWLMNEGWGLADDMRSWLCPTHFTLLP